VRTAEVLASRILFWGGVLSILLMALGIIGHSWRWGAPGAPQAPHERTGSKAADPLGFSSRETAPPGVYTSIGEVAHALRRWPVDPLAIVATGILLLLMTPFVGVVAVFVVFVGAGDRRYAAIAAVLIGALLVSLTFVGR
jgi:hypothetical protein